MQLDWLVEAYNREAMIRVCLCYGSSCLTDRPGQNKLLLQGPTPSDWLPFDSERDFELKVLGCSLGTTEKRCCSLTLPVFLLLSLSVHQVHLSLRDVQRQRQRARQGQRQRQEVRRCWISLIFTRFMSNYRCFTRINQCESSN